MNINHWIGAPLRISALSGPTLHSEGPSIEPALIVRLAGCNLDCSWCFDQATPSQKMTVSDVADWVLAHDVKLVVIAGEDPLVQQRPLLPLAIRLNAAGRRIEIETDGTVVPATGLTNLVTQFHVSPQLASSGVPADQRIRSHALRVLRNGGKARFTFAIADDADIAELIDIQKYYKLNPVYVTPAGQAGQAVLAGIRAPAITHGWTLAPRLQPLLRG